jgi:hypothetical protein
MGKDWPIGVEVVFDESVEEEEEDEAKGREKDDEDDDDERDEVEEEEEEEEEEGREGIGLERKQRRANLKVDERISSEKKERTKRISVGCDADRRQEEIYRKSLSRRCPRKTRLKQSRGNRA